MPRNFSPRPMVSVAASGASDAGSASGSSYVRRRLEKVDVEAKDVAEQLKAAWADLRKNRGDDDLREMVQDLKKKEADLEERRKALEAKLSGAAGGRRKPADEATQLWWRLLPQAEVKTVVLKVLAEDGGVANVPAAEQAGEEGDVVRVPKAVLEEVQDEMREASPAARQGGTGDVVEVLAVAAQQEEGLVEGCSVEAELLQLAGGSTFPGTEGPDKKPLSKLLLRKCYHSIADKCMELSETEGRALVIGSPGAGKSYSSHELLRRLRLAGKTVVWQSKAEASVLLLGSDGNAWEGDLPDFMDELRSPDTWYICDGMEPAMWRVRATTVLITSPRMANINEFVKRRHGELWVGRWKWTELLVARQYIWPTVTVADLKDRVDTVGKLPRYALEQRRGQAWAAVQKAITKSSASLLRDAVGDITTAPPASNKLVHVVASDDCRFIAFDWASDRVAEDVTAELLQRDLVGMEAFVRDFKGVESAGQLRGMQFQRLCGAWISAGAVDQLWHRSLVPRADAKTTANAQPEELLELPQQVLRDVRELPEKLERDHYYRLAKVTQPAVDAISVLSGGDDSKPMEVILWQCTVREEHPVAAVALRKLQLLLVEQHNVVIRGIYFAVPADVYDKWKSCQQEKSDESIDVTSQAARSAFRQAQPEGPRPRGRPPKKSLEEPVLRDAVEALGRIKQFVVKIPATGVEHRPRSSA